MTAKLANRLTLGATLAMFLAALFVLYRQLETTPLSDVLNRLGALPVDVIATAVALTAASYLVLTGYDFLALAYVRRKLRPREVLFASFVAFAFSNAMGLALLSGGSVRYRIYSALGLRAVEIGEIVAFCTLSYALGVCADAGLVLLVDPFGMAALLHLPDWLALVCGVALLLLPVSYLAATMFYRRPIRIGSYALRLPSPRLGLAQIALASLDQLVAGSVVYVLLAHGQEIPFLTFAGVYLTAAPAAVASLVPGGLGVFETMVVVLLPHMPKGALLGALVAYRVIYFLLPLALALGCALVMQLARAPADLTALARAAGALQERLANRVQKLKKGGTETPRRGAKAFGEARN